MLASDLVVGVMDGPGPQIGLARMTGWNLLRAAGRRRRVGVLAAITLALSTAIVSSGCGSASPDVRLVASQVRTRTHVDPAGWSVRFPDRFHLEISNQEQGTAMTEGTIANFAPRRGVVLHKLRNGGSFRVVPPLSHDGHFPAGGVAFRVVNDSSNPFVAPHHSPPRLPLNLTSFRPSTVAPSTIGYNGGTGETYNAGYHGAPRSVMRTVIANGGLYTAVAWIGPRADAQDRAAIGRIVTSLRFPKSHG